MMNQLTGVRRLFIARLAAHNHLVAEADGLHPHDLERDVMASNQRRSAPGLRGRADARNMRIERLDLVIP